MVLLPFLLIATLTQSTDPTIRVSVDLVQVDAVVTDAAGKHVEGLGEKDFEILEDGRPQRITHFSFVRAAQRTTQAPAAAPYSKASAPVTPMRREQVSRTIALVADDLGLSAERFPAVKTAMKNFVDQRMQPGDVVSILTSSGGNGAFQQFTNDPRQLHAAIDTMHWFPGRAGLSSFAPVEDGDPTMTAKLQQVRGEMRALQARVAAENSSNLAAGTLSAVRYAIQGLKEMPGRKGLVLVSEGFQYSPFWDNLIDEANRAGVVLYTIDARGMTVTGLTAADDAHPGGRAGVGHIRALENTRIREFTNSQQAMARIAKDTGGEFFANNNDLGAVLGDALEDMGAYYLIGYQPQRDEYALQFHRIEVRVKRAGLHVRSRSGFFGAPDFVLPSLAPGRVETMKTALYTPFRGGIGVQLRVLCGAGEKDPKTGKRGAILRGQMVIDAGNLNFEALPDGRRKAVLDVVGAAFGVDGRMVANDDKTYTVTLTEKEWKETVATGFLYEMAVPVPKPGAAQFRAAVRDVATGKTGSASAFVETPDFSRAGLALSSPDLGIVRSFAPGAVVKFSCDVYGLQGDAGGKVKVPFQVRLWRGNERVMTGPVVTMPEQEVVGRVRTAGSIRLPEGLPAGEYAMEIVVANQVSGWGDFTIPQ